MMRSEAGFLVPRSSSTQCCSWTNQPASIGRPLNRSRGSPTSTDRPGRGTDGRHRAPFHGAKSRRDGTLVDIVLERTLTGRRSILNRHQPEQFMGRRKQVAEEVVLRGEPTREKVDARSSPAWKIASHRSSPAHNTASARSISSGHPNFARRTSGRPDVRPQTER